MAVKPVGVFVVATLSGTEIAAAGTTVILVNGEPARVISVTGVSNPEKVLGKTLSDNGIVNVGAATGMVKRKIEPVSSTSKYESLFKRKWRADANGSGGYVETRQDTLQREDGYSSAAKSGAEWQQLSERNRQRHKDGHRSEKKSGQDRLHIGR